MKFSCSLSLSDDLSDRSLPDLRTGDTTEAQIAEGVVRTLSAFVGAAVRGLVREAMLVGPPQMRLGYIADHAGCAVFEAKSEADGLTHALATSRAKHVLIVRAGYVPETGFAEAIEDCCGSARPKTRAG